MWRARLDTSVSRCRGAVAATQSMLAAEVAKCRLEVASACDTSEFDIVTCAPPPPLPPITCAVLMGLHPCPLTDHGLLLAACLLHATVLAAAEQVRRRLPGSLQRRLPGCVGSTRGDRCMGPSQPSGHAAAPYVTIPETLKKIIDIRGTLPPSVRKNSRGLCEKRTRTGRCAKVTLGTGDCSHEAHRGAGDRGQAAVAGRHRGGEAVGRAGAACSTTCALLHIHLPLHGMRWRRRPCKQCRPSALCSLCACPAPGQAGSRRGWGLHTTAAVPFWTVFSVLGICCPHSCRSASLRASGRRSVRQTLRAQQALTSASVSDCITFGHADSQDTWGACTLSVPAVWVLKAHRPQVCRSAPLQEGDVSGRPADGAADATGQQQQQHRAPAAPPPGAAASATAAGAEGSGRAGAGSPANAAAAGRVTAHMLRRQLSPVTVGPDGHRLQGRTSCAPAPLQIIVPNNPISNAAD